MSRDGFAAFMVLTFGALCGCSVEYESRADAYTTLHVSVSDVDSNPIAGALVKLTIDGVAQQLTTDMNGLAVFSDEAQVSVMVSSSPMSSSPRGFPRCSVRALRSTAWISMR